jgi:tRNA1(Val) A37 N6-methylase TrmN6
MSEKQAIFTLLNGRVNMARSIYNPTSDAVWLAAYAPTAVKTVLDVGIGTGGVSLCLLAHNKNANITGIDISQEMLDACQQNIKLNQSDIKLLNQDILNWSTTERFDLVITNPPYFNGTPAKHNAHHNIDIKNWTKSCCARVAPKGCFCTVTDALCVDKIISVLENKHFGDIQIFPLFGTKPQAERVLIRAKLGFKTGCTIYRGTSMNNDAILRDGLTIDALLSTLDTL